MSPFTGQLIPVPLFVKDLSDRQREFTLQSVFYSGDNLIRFATDQKVKNPQNKMILNSTTNKYTFGKYSLENLTQTSTEYAQVLSILNGN